MVDYFDITGSTVSLIYQDLIEWDEIRKEDSYIAVNEWVKIDVVVVLALSFHVTH